MRRRRVWVGFLGLLAGAGCWGESPKTDFKPTTAHRDLTASHSEGADWLNTSRPLRAEDLVGRVILVDFWTYACVNCIHVIPDLQALENEFGSKLTVVGVHSGKFEGERGGESIRSAVIRHELTHPVVNDGDFSIWNSFDVHAWPTLKLIGSDGKVEATYAGEGHREALRKDISRLIGSAGRRLNTAPLPLRLERDRALGSVLSFPGKLALDAQGARLFVADTGHHRVLTVSLKPGSEGAIVTTIGSEKEAGWVDGPAEGARFRAPQGLAYLKDANALLVADTGNHRIRRINLGSGQVTTVAGNGDQGRTLGAGTSTALKTALSSPWDLVERDGEILIAMAGCHQIWGLDLITGKVRVVAGSGKEGIDDGVFPANSLAQPSGFSPPLADLTYFVDPETSALRRLRREKGADRVETRVGTGLFDFGFRDGGPGVALLQHPTGVWAEGREIFLADSFNHAIRRYDPKTGQVRTLAGDGKPGFADGRGRVAKFNEPSAILRFGERLLIADTNNHQIRSLDPRTGDVRTLPIHLPTAVGSRQPNEKLPRLAVSPAMEFRAGSALGVRVLLAPGWKLNAQAPSGLAVFTRRGEGRWQLVGEFGRADLIAARGRALAGPVLADGDEARVQGTLYFCREGKESLCYIQSRDFRGFARAKGSAEATIALPE